QVERIREELLETLAPIAPRSTTVPFYSTVTGAPIDTATLNAEYWYTNLRQTVQLDTATKALARDGYGVFIEASPHPVLTMALQETLDAANADSVVTGTLRRNEGGPTRFLASAAHLFTHGTTIDWQTTLTPDTHHRTDLPTYAFDRRSYWLEPATASTATTTGADPVESAFWDAVEREDLDSLLTTLDLDAPDTLLPLLPSLASWRRRSREQAVTDSWRYRITWKPLADPRTTVPSGTWPVVVPAGAPEAQQVIEALRDQGMTVVPLEVKPADADREALASQLREALDGTAPAGVLSLLALTDGPHPGCPDLPVGLGLTLTLIQALGDAGVDAPLWLATRGAVTTAPAGTAGSDLPVDPVQAAVWGLGRVAALEHPQRWGGMIDLPESLDGRAAALLCAALAGPEDEDQLAVRGTRLLVRRLVRSSLAAADPVPAWKPRGTVLITGGTGGIGSQTARWLARNGAEHLVLTSRSGAAAPGAQQLEAELTDLGARVTLAACDVTDLDALTALVRQLEADGSTIRTVMHIAGAGVLVPLADTDLLEFSDTAHAKIVGAANLDAVFDGSELDAFVLFSSISAVWGSGEHGAYAAANAYLDGLAERRRARGLAATSVVWGIWSPEDGGGMAANLAEEQLRGRGIPFMSPRLAIDAFQQVMDRDDSVVVVADVDWERFVPVFTSARPSPLLGGVPEVARILATEAAPAETGGDDSSMRLRLAGLTAEDRRRALSELVCTQIAAVLGYPGPAAVDESRAFRELGFDSLSAVDLRNRLTAATGLRLPVTVVFDYPRARALAEHLGTALFPDQGRTAPADPAEAEVRELLDSIPLLRLQESGLLDELRRLAQSPDTDSAAVLGDDDSAGAIDDLDVDGLIRMAYDK
ncbi:type I polyketide synthase, partial [Kitasatospora sp. NPDC057692]|uniref:type I polyketide synthase n=1 Tax=Kitasatospora sp. NPDC057692 TaxID=3346215 RepID=UPI0036C517C8